MPRAEDTSSQRPRPDAAGTGVVQIRSGSQVRPTQSYRAGIGRRSRDARASGKTMRSVRLRSADAYRDGQHDLPGIA